MFLTTPVVLEGVPHTGAYSFIVPPLVMNEMGSILAKKRLLLVEGGARGAVGAVAGCPLACACSGGVQVLTQGDGNDGESGGGGAPFTK